VESQKHLSLREYMRVIRKRWKVVAVFTLLGLGIGLYKYYTATPSFLASSQVLVERPSGYVISSVATLGTATSTKQQIQFVATENYQQLARSLAELAPRINLDLRDQAVLDDIGSVIQTEILNSEFVTPARLVLYRQPSVNLLSFQQERTLKESPTLGKDLVLLGRMAKGPDFDLYRGWQRGRPGSSDRHVWDNLLEIADSPLMRSLKSVGVTEDAAVASMSTTDEQDRESLTIGTRLQMAGRMLGLVSRLDEAAETDVARGRNIRDMSSPEEVLEAIGEVMTSPFVTTMPQGPGATDWSSLTPVERFTAIDRAGEAFWLMQRESADTDTAVWDVAGKEAEENSDIISIDQVDGDPDKARTGANAMAAIVVWKDRMTRVADAERSVRFLQSQLGDDDSGATRDLRNAEDALTAFRKRNRMLDIDTSLKLAVQQAADLEQQKGEVEASIRQADASLRKTEQQLGGTEQWNIAPTIRQNPLVEDIKSNLIRVETELASLYGKDFTDEWPAVKALKAEKESLEAALNEQARRDITEQYTPDPVHLALAQKAADLAAQRVGLEARQTALTGLLNGMNGRFDDLPDTQADMVRLMRAYELQERQFNELYARLVDARNRKVMGQGNARVIQPAVEPGEKVSPRMRGIAFAILLATFFGALCALVLSSTDTHIRTADDVRRELNVPVLAHLPAIPQTATLVVEAMPTAAVTEAFRALRSTIRFLGTDKPIQTLTATSTKAAEGKSTVLANLAASLAQAGLTVTAVDADLRRPRLATFFGVPTAGGLVDALGGAKPVRSVRQATRIPGLYVVPAGESPANPGELLDNGRIGRVVEELREGNDLVLVDTPPIGVVTDAALVGSATDATILILESGSVEPDEARAALDRLTKNARANVIGVVLVGGEAPISDEYIRYVSTPNGAGNGHAKSGGSRRSRGQSRV